MLYYFGPSWHYRTRLKALTFTLSDGAHTWKHLDHLVACIGRLTAKTVSTRSQQAYRLCRPRWRGGASRAYKPIHDMHWRHGDSRMCPMDRG
jgi:hypothetical protein